MTIRVAAFIDGFNLYHAIDDLKKNHLKWVDLRELMRCFTSQDQHEIVAVYYFSAFATWKNSAYTRHLEYVAALRECGTTPVMGQFKEKDRACRTCGSKWTAHEEKETDVNIAVRMIVGAMDDEFDEAFLVSGDSDLAEPCRILRDRFPDKTVKLIVPPGRRHSKELWGIVDKRKKILESHIEKSLFPDVILGCSGKPIATRPAEYMPPV